MIEQYDLSFLDLNQILKVIHTRGTDIHGLVENGISSYNVGMPILEHPELNSLHKIIKKYINVYIEKYNICIPWIELILRLLHLHMETVLKITNQCKLLVTYLTKDYQYKN